MRRFALSLFILSLAAPALASLPPIKRPEDAFMQLKLKGEAKQKAALTNLAKACRGRTRRALLDHARVKSALLARVTGPSDDVAKAALDAYRCVSPKVFATVLDATLSTDKPARMNYAAEVSARVSDPAVVPVLLRHWEANAGACEKDGLGPAEQEVCVWLSYAPSANLSGASEVLRTQAGALAVRMFSSPYAKVREVAVETLAATELGRFKPDLKTLIANEKKGAFKNKNDAALIDRFKRRLGQLK